MEVPERGDDVPRLRKNKRIVGSGDCGKESADGGDASASGSNVFVGDWSGEMSVLRRRQLLRRVLALGCCGLGLIGLLSRYTSRPELPSVLTHVRLEPFPWRWAWLWNWLSRDAAAGDRAPAGSREAWSRTSTCLAWLLCALPCVHYVAHAIGSAIIVPGQMRVLRLARQVLSTKVVQTRFRATTATIEKQLDWLIDQQATMRRNLVSKLASHNLVWQDWVLRTPDDAALEALVVHANTKVAGSDLKACTQGHPLPPSDDRTAVVLLNGNAQCWQGLSGGEVAQYGSDVDIVLLVNYRGFAGSGGTLTRAGMVVDGATSVQFLVRQFGVLPRNIVVVGHSIGGGVAGEIATLFGPLGVNFCFDRTFADIGSVAPYIVLPFLNRQAIDDVVMARTSPKAKIRSWQRWAYWFLVQGLRIVVIATDWNLCPLAGWSSIAKGYAWVLWHPADEVIPVNAQLAVHLAAGFARGNFHSNAGPKLVKLEESSTSQHNRALNHREMATQSSLIRFAFQRGSSAAS